MTDQKRTKTPRGRGSVGTTLRRDEVEAFLDLIAIIERGGDVSIVLRHPSMGTLRRKFQGMRDRLK